MSKECPSCHNEVSRVYQCVDCNRMFCDICGNVLFVFPSRCPDCEGLFMGRGEQVSRDDDEIYEEDKSHENEETLSETSSSDYSSSDYNSSSNSEPWGEGIIALVVIVIIIAVLIPSKQNSNSTKEPIRVQNTNQIQHTTSPQPSTIYLFQNTLPGTYSMGRGEGQNQSESSNLYCGSISNLAWYFAEFCRNPELARMNRRVTRLQSIYDMAEDGHAQSFEDMRWQNKVDATCREDKSPSACLHAELEARFRWLEEKIVLALVSPRPTIFRDSARELWEVYTKEFPSSISINKTQPSIDTVETEAKKETSETTTSNKETFQESKIEQKVGILPEPVVSSDN